MVKRELIRYGSKLDYPYRPKEKIRLSEIRKVSEVTKKKMFFQNGLSYFEIGYGSNNKILLASKIKSICDSWITYIREGIKYSDTYDMAIRERLLLGVDDPVPDAPIGEFIDLDAQTQVTIVTDEQGSEKLISVNKNKERKFKYDIYLSSFELIKFLGRGAFGRVYKVSFLVLM